MSIEALALGTLLRVSRRAFRYPSVDDPRPWGFARVAGESMRPGLRAGRPAAASTTADAAPGDVVVARFADGTVAVKRAAERRTTRPGGPAGGCSATTRTRGWTRATAASSPRRTSWPWSRRVWPLRADPRCQTRRVPEARRHPMPATRSSTCTSAARWRSARPSRWASRDDLSMAYTPGVARVCEAIAADPAMTRHYTWVPNTVAVVTDGTAVLGLGDIGPAAAMPVMEGKAVLFKQFGGVDGVPICLATTDTEEIIETVARLAPSFGGINLEDISAPALLRDRGPAQGAARHPGLPRRPARHRRRRARRAHQRAQADRPQPGVDPGGHLRRRRRGRRGGQDPAQGGHQGPRRHRPQGRPALGSQRPDPGQACARRR